jgi:hypothetical protein
VGGDTGTPSPVRKGTASEICVDTENRTREYAAWAQKEKRSVPRISWGLVFGLNIRISQDLQQFRAALMALQQQVDDLDYLKGTHYQEIMEAEDEVCASGTLLPRL